MIELNIALLNLNSPYYVVQDADGDLLFETDYGVKYGISFELNEGISENGTSAYRHLWHRYIEVLHR